MSGIESVSRRQRHYSASGEHVCGFGMAPVELSTTISITTSDGELVLICRDMTSRETGEALRVFRQLFPKRDGYEYHIDAKPALGGAA